MSNTSTRLTTQQNDLATATAALSVCHESIFNTEQKICVLLCRTRACGDTDRLVDSIGHLKHYRGALLAMLQRVGRRYLDLEAEIEYVRGIERLGSGIAAGWAGEERVQGDEDEEEERWEERGEEEDKGMRDDRKEESGAGHRAGGRDGNGESPSGARQGLGYAWIASPVLRRARAGIMNMAARRRP